MWSKLPNARLLIAVVLALALVAALACSADEEDAASPTSAAAAAPTSAAAAPTAAAVSPTAAAAVVPTAAADTGGMKTVATDFKGSFVWDGAVPTTYGESPIFAELVKAGTLPPVAERLPDEPMVVNVVERIGDYGGTWRRAFTGPNDGQNADRLMMDENLKYDLDGTTIIPNIAKGYEVNDDATTLTLFLRKGMKWSDGETFDANDYVWWYENVNQNEDINPGRDGALGWSGYSVTNIQKIDDLTVKYTLTEPGVGFLEHMATYKIGGFTLHGRIADGDYGPVHYLEQFHRDFATDKVAYDKQVADAGFESWALYFKDQSNPLRNTEVPVVSPWKMTSPITAQIYEWERNPYYWAVDPAGNQLPYIDKISMILTGDKEVLNLKAIAGEIDFQHRHIDMNKVPVILENADKCDCKVQFWPSPHGAQAGLTINLSYGLGAVEYDVDPEVQKWLFNKDFRIALSLSVDRSRVNEVVFLGLGTIMQMAFIKGHPFYPGDEYALKYVKQDVAEANAILDKIGLSEKDGDGFRLRTDGSGETLIFELSYIAEYFVDYESIAELSQLDFNEIGIKTFLKAEDVKLYADRRAANDHMLMAGGAGDQRYPSNLDQWTAQGQAFMNWYQGGGGTYSGKNIGVEPTNPAILRLAELTDDAKNLDYAARGAIYQEIQEINIDNQFVIGYVGATPAFNGVIVMKNYFKNVPLVAPNQSPLQNPGIARTIQFFIEGGKNDSE